MNKITIELKDKDGNTKEVSFRLNSEACIEIEDTKKMPLLDYIQNESVTMIVDMLYYMRKFETTIFSKNDAKRLYDELIDNGWTYKRIIADIIYEGLVASGFLEKEEWENIKKQAELMKAKIQEKTQDTLENL